MPECPRCKKQINSLVVYSNEVNVYTVNLEDSPEPEALEWTRKKTMAESCSEDNYYCPECDQLLFTNDGRTEQPQNVIDFLADYKRCCAKCKRFESEDATESTGECEEGGFTEVGNPYEERTEEDCSGFIEKT
ncbi:hypothetical protein ES703_54787 [subsurface metagenome]